MQRTASATASAAPSATIDLGHNEVAYHSDLLQGGSFAKLYQIGWLPMAAFKYKGPHVPEATLPTICMRSASTAALTRPLAPTYLHCVGVPVGNVGCP